MGELQPSWHYVDVLPSWVLRSIPVPASAASASHWSLQPIVWLRCPSMSFVQQTTETCCSAPFKRLQPMAAGCMWAVTATRKHWNFPAQAQATGAAARVHTGRLTHTGALRAASLCCSGPDEPPPMASPTWAALQEAPPPDSGCPDRHQRLGVRNGLRHWGGRGDRSSQRRRRQVTPELLLLPKAAAANLQQPLQGTSRVEAGCLWISGSSASSASTYQWPTSTSGGPSQSASRITAGSHQRLLLCCST